MKWTLFVIMLSSNGTLEVEALGTYRSFDRCAEVSKIFPDYRTKTSTDGGDMWIKLATKTYVTFCLPAE